MNGASADPWANTRSVPTSTITTMMGSNHHFFLTLKNAQNSRTKLGFAILSPLTVSELMCQIASPASVIATIHPERAAPHGRQKGVAAEEPHH